MKRRLVTAFFASLIAIAFSSSCFADSYGIVMPINASKTVEHAAKELGKFLNQMTRERVITGASAKDYSVVFLLDVSGSNPAAKALSTEPKEWASEKSTDAYYLKSVKSNGKNYIVLSGKSDPAVLYAVYEYLERYGGCGFFEDGDYVPSKAPKITGVDYFTSPRFSFRHFRGDLCGFWGIKKFHCLHRTMDDWIPFYDWLAKRRINVADYYPQIASGTGGLAIEMAFGMKDEEPGERYGGGWPNSYCWPAEVRTRLIQRRLSYQRRLGMKSMMSFSVGLTSVPFKKAHPEMKWISAGYDHAMIHPDDPSCYYWSKRFLEAIIGLYGTDHLYYDTPYCEFLGADTFDKALDQKISAAKQDCKLFKEVDPEATWISDSWDFSALPDFWTIERKDKYFKSVPNDMLLLADATTDLAPQYGVSNYFFGVPWAVGVLHSFQGDDHLHGDLQALINGIKNAADDPKSDKLTGYFHIPEIHGANILFWQLSTELAWNPKDLTLDQFLADYTRRRFGDESFPAMLKAEKAMVEGVYKGNGQTPIYKKIGAYENLCPIWEGNYNNAPGFLNSLPDITSSLRSAINTALTQKDLQKDNQLYTNDMVEWTKCYLGHLFNYYIIKGYQDFKAGDARALETDSQCAQLCLKAIEDILSTTPDYHLQNTIDQAMSVPGVNPSTPKMIKHQCIIWHYAPNDCYEQTRFIYRPRAALYFKSLKDRLKNENRSLVWGDISGDCGKIEARWLNEPIAIPASEHFKGTTIEAVIRAMDLTRRLICEK